MEDSNGDGDKLERLRRVMDGIDPEVSARMSEPLPPRGKANRSGVSTGFPMLGLIVVVIGVAVVVAAVWVIYLGARTGNLQFGSGNLPIGP